MASLTEFTAAATADNGVPLAKLKGCTPSTPCTSKFTLDSNAPGEPAVLPDKNSPPSSADAVTCTVTPMLSS